MNGLFNPDSWMDVVALIAVALIVGIPSTIAAVAGVRGHRAAKQANEQVSNSHPTNFRDDHDRVEQKVDDALGRIDDLAADLRGYIKEDRAFRRDMTRRMQTQERIADQHHPGER